MPTIVRCDASFENRRRIVLAGMAAIICICIVWATVTLVYAEDSFIKRGFDEIIHSMGEAAGDGLFNAVDEVYNKDHEDKTSEVYVAMEAIRNKFNADGSVIYTVGNAVSGLALVLSFFYAFIALIKELQRGDVTVDIWLKFGLILGIAAVLIFNWHTLADGLDDLGAWIANEIKEKAELVDDTHKLQDWFDETFDFGDDLESVFDIRVWRIPGNIWENVKKILVLPVKLIGAVIVWAILKIPLIGIRVTLFAMVIEIYIRRAFIPLAIADVGGHGARSAGVAYLKSYFGLYLRIGMCYLIAAFGQAMLGTVLQEPTGTFFGFMPKLIIVYIVYKTALKLFQSAKTWSDLVMGR